MSKVYEALKKAEREGRWRDDIPQTPAAVDGSCLPSKAVGSAAEAENIPASPVESSTEIPKQSTSAEERTPAVSSSLEPAQGNQASTNGADADNIFTRQESPVSGTSISWRVGSRWRFWQRDPAAFEARGPALIIHQESLARAGEQFQVLRANLESWVLEHDKRVILITSAVPGEGKSFVALNLAAALSHAGSEVLLVDADLRAPALHLPFNLIPLTGLLPYLEGKAEFSDSITSTPSPRLRLMAAAGATLSGPEAFASSRMRVLIQRARELKPPHFVLIDSPAALAGPEAQILSKLVDGILLVVAANMTPRAVVTKTLELIKGVPVFSVVLNRFEFSYSASRHLHYYSKHKPDAEA
jgi:capsular exopolysaccharide synthesis family protein